MEESKREKLKLDWQKAIEYERRIERERERGIAKECIKEGKAGKENQERIKERRDHLKRCGFN